MTSHRRQFKKAVKKISALCWDLDKDIPFKNNNFDIVWAGDVIEHVFDPIGLLSEINRVLKKEGRLFLTVPNNFNIHNRFYIFLSGKSIQSNLYRSLGQCKHHTYFSLELLQYMLHKNDFLIDKFYSVYKLPAIHRLKFAAKKKTTGKKIIGQLLGTTFIINARKSNVP